MGAIGYLAASELLAPLVVFCEKCNAPGTMASPLIELLGGAYSSFEYPGSSSRGNTANGDENLGRR